MQATLEALAEEMARNPPIFVLGEGIGKRGGNFKTTAGLYELYGPERLCDTPICERGFVGLGGGAAMTGTRPVIDFMFADFILDAVGEIVNQIAKMQYMSNGRLKMPILLRGCIGIGHSAATHHSGNYYPHVRSFSRAARRRPVDALRRQGAAAPRPALRRSGPVPRTSRALRERAGAGATTRSPSARRPSSAKDATSPWWPWHSWSSARKRPAKNWPGEGISVELIDPRTVAPLDIEQSSIRPENRPAADRR